MTHGAMTSSASGRSCSCSPSSASRRRTRPRAQAPRVAGRRHDCGALRRTCGRGCRGRRRADLAVASRLHCAARALPGAVEAARRDLARRSGRDPGRPVLDGYSQELVDRLVSVLAIATVLVYAAYTLTAGNSRWMAVTVPFVAFGIGRYVWLVRGRGAGESRKRCCFATCRCSLRSSSGPPPAPRSCSRPSYAASAWGSFTSADACTSADPFASADRASCSEPRSPITSIRSSPPSSSSIRARRSSTERQPAVNRSTARPGRRPVTSARRRGSPRCARAGGSRGRHPAHLGQVSPDGAASARTPSRTAAAICSSMGRTEPSLTGATIASPSDGLFGARLRPSGRPDRAETGRTTRFVAPPRVRARERRGAPSALP